MNPTRRTVLRTGGLAAVAALAGCVAAAGAPRNTDDDSDGADDGAGSGFPGDDTDDGDSDAGTRPSGTGGPSVSIADVDPDPDLPVRPAVEVVREAATEDHPPGLRVTVTNESDRSVRIGEGRDVVFAYVSDTGGHLILLPADGEYEAEPGCWRLREPILITEEYRTVEIDPGASVSRRVDLYGAAGPDSCLPVGEFRFESTYTTLDEELDAEERAEWGFSLALE